MMDGFQLAATSLDLYHDESLCRELKSTIANIKKNNTKRNTISYFTRLLYSYKKQLEVFATGPACYY